jgi:hypothetical protein
MEQLSKITLTVKQAAEISQIGVKEIYWQIKNNPKFPYFNIGKKVLIPRAPFEEWVLSLVKCNKNIR